MGGSYRKISNTPVRYCATVPKSKDCAKILKSKDYAKIQRRKDSKNSIIAQRFLLSNDFIVLLVSLIF